MQVQRPTISRPLSRQLHGALYYARKRRRQRYLDSLPTTDPEVLGQNWNNNGRIQQSEGPP